MRAHALHHAVTRYYADAGGNAHNLLSLQSKARDERWIEQQHVSELGSPDRVVLMQRMLAWLELVDHPRQPRHTRAPRIVQSAHAAHAFACSLGLPGCYYMVYVCMHVFGLCSATLPCTGLLHQPYTLLIPQP
jgi:hypothetical protein